MTIMCPIITYYITGRRTPTHPLGLGRHGHHRLRLAEDERARGGARFYIYYTNISV